MLAKILDERTSTADERNALIARLGTAANIPATKVQEIIDGAVDLPPQPWIRAFSAVLDVPEYLLGSATDRDVSDFMQSLEPDPTVETLTNAARSVVQNCSCQQPAADDVLSTVVSAAAETTRRLAR